MTYQAQESSIHGGAPLELFRFAQGTRRWTLTPHAEAIVYAGETYAPTAIERTAPEIGTEAQRASITVRLPRTHELAAALLAAAPEDIVSLTVYRRHFTDPDAETIVFWRGRVATAKLAGSLCELACEPLLTIMQRPGLRARYGLACRHPLYSPGCGAPQNSFRTAGVIQSVSGATLTINAAGTQPNGYFTAGLLLAGDVRRFIAAHAGTTITLLQPAPALAAGMAVDLYAGCDHTLATCHTRFANSANFGGFPWIPLKNPFAGDAIV